MALTLTKTREGVMGDLRYWAGTLTFDASYTTGGLAFTAANLGWKQILQVNPEPPLGAGKSAAYDTVNAKLVLYVEGASIFAEAANASNQSTVVIPVFVIGY